jgi:hypothetical protein
MTKGRNITILGAVTATLLASTIVYGQSPAPVLTTSQSAIPYAPGQLDQMLAPIALYPDEMLGAILTAATYPLEIVQADRWLQDTSNRALKGDQLTAALENQPWDASVKSLVPFPPVLKMLDDNLQWTEKVGDAFLADQASVMDSVQRLRRQAQTEGRLKSNPQEAISTVDQDIVIEPASSASVYIPCYNSVVVYDPWPWPEYPPVFFPDYVCAGPWITFGIGYPFGPYWGWDRWDWHNHRLHVDVPRFNSINRGRPPITSDVWQHNALDRHGVPYRDPASRAKYQPNQSQAPDARREIRGYSPRAPNITGLSEQSRPVPLFEAPARSPDVRAQSARGSMSRSSPPAGGLGGARSGGLGGVSAGGHGPAAGGGGRVPSGSSKGGRQE